MSTVDRMLDANANRAREAMRVMEDTARFLLNDALLASAIKQLRHDFASAMKSHTDFILDRDTPGDVGTAIHTEAEGQRDSEREVIVAAGKRLSEALRTIEEFTKTTSDGQLLATSIEQLRYRGYELERQLVAAMGSARRQQWRICVLITEALCQHHAWQSVVDQVAAVSQSVGDNAGLCVQLREKNLEGGELLKRAKWLVSTCKTAHVSTIINDRPDIAKLAEADGVHLGQGDLPVADARRIVGFRGLIGVSTSHLDQAKAAFQHGADYCGVGPMFETMTKDKPKLSGPQYLREFMQWNCLPHLAIGGIDPRNIATLVDAGVRGVAVSSCVCAATEPGDVVRALLDALV